MIRHATLLLTRPAGRNEALADCLSEQGLACLTLPALQLDSRIGLSQSYRSPVAYDAIIFVSSTAAALYFEAMRVVGDSLPNHVCLAAVGQATGRFIASLEAASSHQVLYPEPQLSLQDSEALWCRLQPHLSNWRRILIVRGQRGREWLSDRLAQKGLKVDRIAIYSRSPVRWTHDQFKALRQAYDKGRVLCLLSSSESLYAIADNMKQARLLEKWAQSEFIVIHPRIESALQHLLQEAGIGHQAVVKRCTPSDASVVEAIMAVLSHE